MIRVPMIAIHRKSVLPNVFALRMTIGMFIILFLGDLFSGFGYVPEIAPDLVIVFLQFVLLAIASVHSSCRGDEFKTPGLVPVVCLMVVSISSSVLSGQGLVETVVFLRSVIGQYIIFLSLVNIGFTDQEFKRINAAIFLLCAIQIPTAVFRLFSEGTSLVGVGSGFGVESAAGTFGSANGAMGTIFPLATIGVLFAFYLLKQKRAYLIWMLGFIIFSFCSGKRSFPFLLPVFIVSLFYLIREKNIIITKKAVIMVGVSCSVLLAGLFLHPSLNPSRIVGGTIDLRYAVDRVVAYETHTTWDNKTSGRLATSQHLVTLAVEKGVVTFFFGNGPATLIKSGLIRSNYNENLDAMGIAYGITGAGWLFSQVGLLGVLCFLWLVFSFLRRIIRIRTTFRESYWRAICGGLVGLHLVILYDTMAYSTTSVAGKVIPALWYLLLAQVLWRSDSRDHK